MKLAYAITTSLLAASLSASAALINYTDAFATSTVTVGDDTAATEAAHSLSYTHTAASISEIRTQNNPFANGGTLFMAGFPNTIAQSATYLASNTGIGADAGDTRWDTSSALTLTADFANNYAVGSITSGFMLEGTTSGLIVSWGPGGTSYSAGVSGLSATAPTDVVNVGTFAGAASAPSGTGLAAVTLSLVENGANYDFTLTMGGSDNTFSVAQSALGDVAGLGFYNSGEGNTNIDNVVLDGTTIPEPATLGLVAIFGGSVLFIRRKLMI